MAKKKESEKGARSTEDQREKMPGGITGKGFKPGQSGNLLGKPKGTRNRSTIARMVMAQEGVLPEKVFKALKETYPGIEQSMSIEEVMTYIQVNKAIQKQDTQAYRAVIDSAYPQATINQVDFIEPPLFPDEPGEAPEED